MKSDLFHAVKAQCLKVLTIMGLHLEFLNECLFLPPGSNKISTGNSYFYLPHVIHRHMLKLSVVWPLLLTADRSAIRIMLDWH